MELFASQLHTRELPGLEPESQVFLQTLEPDSPERHLLEEIYLARQSWQLALVQWLRYRELESSISMQKLMEAEDPTGTYIWLCNLYYSTPRSFYTGMTEYYRQLTLSLNAEAASWLDNPGSWTAADIVGEELDIPVTSFMHNRQYLENDILHDEQLLQSIVDDCQNRQVAVVKILKEQLQQLPPEEQEIFKDPLRHLYNLYIALTGTFSNPIGSNTPT